MPLVHHSYTVYISSNGKELPQHSIDVGQDVVRCKIPRKAGMPFKIHVSDSGEYDKCIRVYVDGQYLTGVAARGGVSVCLESVRTSAQTTRAFLFAPSHPRPPNASDPMGIIEVRIVRAERTSKPPTPRIINTYGLAKQTSQPVGHGHIVLSEESESAVKATQSYRPTQSWDEPLLSFQFCCEPGELNATGDVDDDESGDEFEYDELDSDEELLDISWASTPSASSSGSSQFPVDLTDSPATSPSPSASNQSSLKRAASLVDVDSDSLSDVHRQARSREPQRALIPGPSQRSSSQTRLGRHLKNALDEDSPPKRRVKRRIEVNLKPYTVIETTRSARAKYNKRGYGMSSKKRRVKSPMDDA
ncbi:hypothetical protein PENSPDRAFT_431876 [Peniophora sp. CONT]|nr:hypothetical protein PENSPDRAFT_431876 [Peniophora sp. CONT]